MISSRHLTHQNHRRRLLEMTVGGGRFPSPPLHVLLRLLPPKCCLTALILPSPSPSPVTPSSLLYLSLPLPCPYPLNSVRQRVQTEPSGQTLLVHFQAEIRAPFHFHNETFCNFTVPFGCVQWQHNKFLCGALRASPPQLFGRRAIALMESAPMIRRTDVINYSVSQKKFPRVFLTFFPKRSGILVQILNNIIHFCLRSTINFYLIIISPTVRKLCHIKRDHCHMLKMSTIG